MTEGGHVSLDSTSESEQANAASESECHEAVHDTREEITLELDNYVLEWFSLEGEPAVEAINKVLRDYIETVEATGSQASATQDDD